MKKLVVFILTFLFCSPVFAQEDPLSGITIEPEQNASTYKRSLYKHWTDADGDGLSTRQEVLVEEKLAGTLWVGSYTGKVTIIPNDLDVDHMVPLKETHRSGGHAWSKTKRQEYANDMSSPEHLIAVAKGSNRSKGAKDPANWMPPNRSFWCQYLEDWIAVKKRWELSMDQAEADAIKKGLKVCKKYKVGDHLNGRH